jgi:glutaminyl-peptide cyclotransferase
MTFRRQPLSSRPKWRDRSIAILAAIAMLSLSMANASASAPPSPKPGAVSGEHVFALTKELLAVAPKRFAGSPGHLAAENFIKSHFAPEIASGRFETDSFAPNTPIGTVPMRNYIVRYPGKKDGVIVLASHYETNYPLKDIGFVGANDGACTTALLIALGEYFRAHPPEGYSVWLVFDDGEEAIKEWSASDSLYGTRHLAAKWSGDGTLKKIKAFIVADMIGDRDLNIDHDANSTPDLEKLLSQAAKNTGHSTFVFKNETQVEDDHLPFKMRGVPVLDIIDLDYGPHNAQTPDGYHHTAQDTIDKISAHSLQVSADLFLETIHLIDQR